MDYIYTFRQQAGKVGITAALNADKRQNTSSMNDMFANII